MKKGMKLTSILLAMSIVLTLLPTTALAALAAPKKLFIVHTADGEDKNWSTTYESYLELLSKASGSHNWAAWTERTDDGLVDLRITHTDMTDAERTDRSVAPYFNVTGGKYQVSRILLQPMNLGDNQPEEVTNYSATVDTLTAIAEKDCYEGKTRVRGNVTVNYVWKFIPEGSEEDKPDTYTVHYTLNQGDAANQLPSNVRPANNSGLRKDFAIAEGGTFSLLPANTDATDLTLQKFSAEGYDLIGWKCEDDSCAVCAGENAAFHQIGEDVTATAARAGEDSTITLTAQWKKWEVPSVEDIGTLDLSDDPPMLVLATVNGKGEMVKITQHNAENVEAVTDELMLDPTTREVYYEATVKMDPSVAGSLKAYIPSPTFAQFRITVNMAEQLKLAGIDEDGKVEFTFTCPFLEPVPGSEVLVDGTAVSGVEVNKDKSPYIYKVPAESLTREDGTIKPFSFLVQWRSTTTNGGIYSADDLSAPMTLKTARAIATSKVPFETTGSVTGWINPKGNLPQNPAQEKGLAYAILNNSPTLRDYLMTKKKLSYEQATSVMLDYLASEDGRNASMKREILPANTLEAYNPCVVMFVNGDKTVDTQYIKYNNGTTQPNMPAYSGGMDFDGWYIRGTDTEFDIATGVVTDDMVLEARWSDHNHDWSEWTVTREPTCVAGERSHTCSICGRVETEAMAAVDPHTPGEAWEQDGTNHWHLCTRCNAPVDIAAHSYPDTWTVRTPATVLDEGLEFHNCTVCNREETRTIDRLPYTPVIPAPTPTPVTPNTPTPTPTPAPGTTIVDEDVPLANVTGLDNTDHFAYIKGYEDGTVRPMKNITRAEVATIFFRLMTDDYRAANWSTTNSFTDVSADAWYNTAISTAAQAGILKGYTDGSVKPDKDITRAEFATIAARFISADITDDGTGDFSDTVGHWAAKEIRLAVKAGWIKGDGNRFRPDESINRAEVMTMVNRMLDRVPDVDHMLPGMKTWSDNPVGTWYYAAVQEATNDHHHERAEDGVTEIWTELAEEKDWDALMAEWIANGGRSAASMEAQRPSWLMS